MPILLPLEEEGGVWTDSSLMFPIVSCFGGDSLMMFSIVSGFSGFDGFRSSSSS